MAHVAEYKKKIVTEFVDLMKQYPIVGAVNMENLPASQLQTMREKLRGTVLIKMTKRRLLNIALDKAEEFKPGISKLKESLIGMPAMLFTEENPFKLYKTLAKSKSKAPAKAGQVAPNDIVVSAGPTNFAPGPIIGELGSFGIKAGIENGKVAIKEDKVVAKRGDVISPKLAAILTRLEIYPMEVGLDLVAVYEEGSILTKDILEVDESEYIEKIKLAHSYAYNLAIESSFFTAETTTQLLVKAYSTAKNLAIDTGLITPELIEDTLITANRCALALKNSLGL